MALRVRQALLGLTLLHLPSTALAWGELAHLRITQEAHALLPNGCLRTWYYDNGEDLLMASVAPDAWRDTDPDEAPRHFLDIDIYGNPSAYPRDLNQAIAQLGANAVLSNGTVPWVAEAVYEQLVDAFTTQNTANAVALSGYLSHYVSDSFSPLHATVNYDGQLTGNPGLHGRYEVDMLEAFDTQVQSGLAAGSQVVAAPLVLHEAIFDVLEVGAGLVPGLANADISAGGNIIVLWASKGQEAVGLMADGTDWVAALWRAAYAEAGSPVMPGMAPSCAGSPPPADAGPRDLGTAVDAGRRDASPVDTGTSPADAGPPVDDASAPVQDASSSGGDASREDGNAETSEDAGPGASDLGATVSVDASVAPDAAEGLDAGSSAEPPLVSACSCDVDVCCSEGCECDAECTCACDATEACEPDCSCDPECNAGCPGFGDPNTMGGSSCQAPLGGSPLGGVILFSVLGAWTWLDRRRGRRAFTPSLGLGGSSSLQPGVLASGQPRGHDR